jgi:hypothetical protein
MNLSINGAHASVISAPDELADALSKAGTNDGDFVILEDGDDDYIQSAIDPDGYIAEVRDGAAATMFRAVRNMPQPDELRDGWSGEDALGLIHAYFPLRSRAPQPLWEDMHMQSVSKSAGARLDWAIRVVAVLVIVAVAGYSWLARR